MEFTVGTVNDVKIHKKILKTAYSAESEHLFRRI